MRVYAAVFLATLSTTVLPLPEEAALLAAGYAARAGDASVFACAAAGLAAVVAGDVASYVFGRTLLARALRTRIGRRLVPEERRAWAERFVAQSDARAIVVARFLPGLRGFVYFAIGASRVPFARFVAVDAVAGAVEVGALVAMGFGFGELRAHVGQQVDLLAAVLLVLVIIGPVVVRRFGARPRPRPRPR